MHLWDGRRNDQEAVMELVVLAVVGAVLLAALVVALRRRGPGAHPAVGPGLREARAAKAAADRAVIARQGGQGLHHGGVGGGMGS